MRACYSTWLLSTAAVLSIGGQAAAQDMTTADRSTVEARPDGGGLEDIVVTARRQSERLQETPLSVSAVSAATLERLNIQSVERVAQLTPNVSLTEGSGTITGISAFIRGIGNQDPLLSLDSPIGIYIDGVYQGRVGGAGSFDLIDLERVEVLRGPQGTLFGRNTTGGAISLVTRAPKDDFHIQLKGGYASFNEWYTRATIDTGEIGGTGLKASVAYLHRERDGIVDNINAPNSRDPGVLNSDAVWAKVEGEWGRFSAAYTFDWNNRKGVPLAFQIAALTPEAAAYYGQSPGLGGGTLTVDPNRRKRIDQAVNPGQDAKIWGHALTLNYELSSALALKSITAYRKFDSFQPTRYAEPDLLGPVFDPLTEEVSTQPVSPFSAPQFVNQHQWSEEFQLLGQTDQWKYVVGLYFFYEKFHEYNPNDFTFLPGGGVGVNLNTILDYGGTAKSYAAFGQASWTPPILDENLEVTFGIRRTKDKKAVQILFYQSPTSDPTFVDAKKSFNNTSYNASLNYKFTPDIMAYVRVGTGYRSGGFNSRGGGLTFEPERATTFEGGLKSEFFDHRLRINLAAFFTRYRDLQVAQLVNLEGFADNANANYPGFELEVQARPVEGLSLDGSLGYVRPKYTLFTQAGVDYHEIGKFPYVPKLTTHVGAEYAFPPFSLGRLSVRVDYSASSKRHFAAFNLPFLNPNADAIIDPGQRWLSARITLADIALGSGSATLSGWAENLTNHDNVTAGIDFGPALGFAGRNYGLPRRFGIDFTLNY